MSYWHDDLNFIKTRLLEGQDGHDKDKQKVKHRLEVYKILVYGNKIDFDENKLAHKELLSIGLVVKQDGIPSLQIKQIVNL